MSNKTRGGGAGNQGPDLSSAPRAPLNQSPTCSDRELHSGFSVHNGVRVRASDPEDRKKLAQYMLRAPFSQEKMTYLPDTGMVMYAVRAGFTHGIAVRRQALQTSRPD